MRFYADQPDRRRRQIAGDLLVLGWVVLWLLVGRYAHGMVSRLAAPARALEETGTSMADGLASVGNRVSDVPLLGDELGAPFSAAGGAAVRLAQAGAELQAGVARTALVVALTVAAWPVVVVLALWARSRLRFARRAAAARRQLAVAPDADLFALRALAHLPLTVLAAVSPDPAADWRRGDPAVVRRLAALQLRADGVEPPPPDRVSPGR